MRFTIAAGWARIPLAPLPYWLLAVLITGLVSVDYATGPYFQFPSAYILLIVMVAWCNGAGIGLALAIALPLTRVALMEWFWNQPWDPFAYTSTALTRMLVWSVLAFMAARLAQHERILRTEVEALISLLPVCADCHKIRGDGDTWLGLESYAKQNANQFSPGLCPSCQRSRLPEHVAPE